MCFALFVASGSFFLGQADEFPEAFRIYPLLAIPAFLPLLAVSRIGGSGDLAETAERIFASESLYRVGLLSLAIGALAVMVLSYALYVTLEPVNKRLAQLALYGRLGEAFIIGAVLVFRFAALRLYTTAHATSPFQDDQVQALVSVAEGAYGSGVQIWLMFFSLGSTLFFYLFYKSRYIPRPLGAFGVFASVVVGLVSVGSLLLPEHAATIQYGWAASFVAEVTTGCWLLIAGIRPEPGPSRVS